MYAKFQDKITNYLEDHMASLIKRTAKDSATIAEAYSKLRLSHAENQSKLDLAMTKSKLMKTQTKLKEKELENDLKNQEAEQRIAEGKQKETLLTQNTEIAKIIDANKKKVMETKSTDILRLCNSAANNITLDKDIFTALDNLEVYIWGVGGANMKMKGEISDSSNSKTLEEYNNDEFKMNIACSDMTKFNIEGIITSKLKDVASEDKWELLHTSDNSGNLDRGVYKVEVAGAKGGDGGAADICDWGNQKGGTGGNGSLEVKFFVVKETEQFTTTKGFKGKDGASQTNGGDCWGHWSKHKGEDGTNGENSVFTLGTRINIVAEGGQRGTGGYARGHAHGSGEAYAGSNGTPGGNGKNGGDGYIKIYRYKL